MQCFGYDDSIYHQHKDLHQDTEQVIKAAEFFIIFSAGINLWQNIKQNSEQKSHTGGDEDRIPAAVSNSSVHIPVGRNLFRQDRIERGCQQDACQSQQIGKNA